MFQQKLACLILATIITLSIFAQKEINAAGGTAKGNGGSTTFTINSFIAKTSSGSGGYLISGVQQPKEITSILPISLLYFTAQLQNNKVALLKWSTSNEYNNKFFTIEKGTDGRNFETLATVKSKGNATATQNYEAIDEKPFATTYYRLKQTDNNGKFTYSTTIVLKRAINKEAEPVLYPNPASSVMYLQMDDVANKKLQYTIVDLQGKVLAKQTIANSTTTIILSSFAPTTYIINVMDETTIIKSFKIIKL